MGSLKPEFRKATLLTLAGCYASLIIVKINKYYGYNVQGDIYCHMIYMKVVKRINPKSSHHKKKNCEFMRMLKSPKVWSFFKSAFIFSCHLDLGQLTRWTWFWMEREMLLDCALLETSQKHTFFFLVPYLSLNSIFSKKHGSSWMIFFIIYKWLPSAAMFMVLLSMALFYFYSM